MSATVHQMPILIDGRVVDISEDEAERIRQKYGIKKGTPRSVDYSPTPNELLRNAARQASYAVDLATTQTEVQHRIMGFALTALEYLEDLISGKIPEASCVLRAKYADKHLSRAGFGEIKHINSMNQHLSREDVERIKQRALEASNEAQSG